MKTREVQLRPYIRLCRKGRGLSSPDGFRACAPHYATQDSGRAAGDVERRERVPRRPSL